MGTSTDGLLWYGVAIDGSMEDGDEIPTQIHALLYGDEADEDNDLYGDGREWFEEHGITGVEFVEHCSGDYPMYGIAVTGSVTTARRGYPVKLPPYPQPDPLPVVQALRALGADPAREDLGWWLASMWG